MAGAVKIEATKEMENATIKAELADTNAYSSTTMPLGSQGTPPPIL